MTKRPKPAFVKTYPSVKNDKLMRDCGYTSGLLNRLNLYLILSSELPEFKVQKMQIKVASAAIISAGVTLTSILRLNGELSLQVKDALALSRVFYETSLNCVFVCADNGERAHRADAYAVIQAYQSQKKFRKIGSTTVLIQNDRGLQKSDPRVVEALKQFSKPNGKLEKVCFRENRDEMIAKIYDVVPHAGIFLSGIEGMLFDISSELIHGSYFGFLESFHGNDSESTEALERHAELVGYTVMFSASSIAHAVIRLLAKNNISDEIIEIGDEYLRLLALEGAIIAP